MGRPSDRVRSTPVSMTLGTAIPKGCSALILYATAAGTAVVDMAGGAMTIPLEANKVIMLDDIEPLKVTAGTATGLVAYALR